MKATITTLVIAATLFAVNVATAQSPTSNYTPPRPIQSPPLVQHHASTFTEGYLRGRADVIRAAGEYNYNTALANVHQQEAVRRAIENHKRYVQTYFDAKEINRQSRAKANGQPVTQEQAIKFNKSRLPARLTVVEYRPATGTFNWPALLRNSMFAAERSAIEKTMEARTPDNTGAGSISEREVKRLATAMENKIRSLGTQLSSAERIAARKFLRSLTYEAQFPASVDVSGLAIR